MENLPRIRFLAANYSNLHGLKYVPMGLALILLSLWGNTVRNPAPDLTLPILFIAVCVALYLIFDRYYAHVFGRVQRTTASLWLEWLSQIAGGILALGAFVVDVSHKLPVSTLGFVFAAAFLVDYLRLTRFAREPFLIYYPVLTILMIAMSLLPLLGGASSWQPLGIAN